MSALPDTTLTDALNIPSDFGGDLAGNSSATPNIGTTAATSAADLNFLFNVPSLRHHENPGNERWTDTESLGMGLITDVSDLFDASSNFSFDTTGAGGGANANASANANVGMGVGGSAVYNASSVKSDSSHGSRNSHHDVHNTSSLLPNAQQQQQQQHGAGHSASTMTAAASSAILQRLQRVGAHDAGLRSESSTSAVAGVSGGGALRVLGGLSPLRAHVNDVDDSGASNRNSGSSGSSGSAKKPKLVCPVCGGPGRDTTSRVCGLCYK